MADRWEPTAEKEIADAVGRTMVLRTSPSEIAAAVVATIQGMSPETLAELRPDLTVEHALFCSLDGYYRTADDAEDAAHLRSMAERSGGEMRSRVVGPWLET